jgi:thiosulfate dehydrogenase (quinone) large subunit|tara:strand:- start:1848 stop:2357 length:510 start_codon:yes stop_codon:yes gene_type:complete
MAKNTKKQTNQVWYALAIARLLLGFTFLWAFIDKTFGLGYATTSEAAWVNGGSPTTGFLKFGINPEGPFVDYFSGLAGMMWVDWLFMLGLLGIGVALVLGVGLKIAAVSGAVLLVMMWLALLPLENNPIVDDHIIYAVILFAIAMAEPRWSLADWWRSQSFVKKNSWLW